MQEMSTVGFCQEPLANNEDGQSLDAALLTVQKSNLDLNSVWREQARMRVKPALEECNNRYFAKLAGGLRFVDTLILVVEGVKQTRIYYNIPESVQSIITKDEIAALKAIGEEGKAIELFRQVIINNDAGALSVAQVAVLTDIHARAQAKHHAPSFGSDDFTLQLHIDARMVPKNQKAEAIDIRSGVSFVLADDKNRLYYRFLDISGVAPHDDRIRLPLVLSKKIAKRISSTNKEWASLILEISENSYGVRL